jgi:pimeloyl-ACP methyl ester carboxylesterase
LTETWTETLIRYGILPDPGRYFVKVEKLSPLKGTYFFGGAGFNGDYIPDMVKALQEAGISNVRAGHTKESVGRQATDNATGASFIDAFMVTQLNSDIGAYLTITADEFGLNGPQFNLIGYSYGTLIAAHKAISYSDLYNGTVDHLVLIGAPMQESLLQRARRAKNIKKIVLVSLKDKGDPIDAGMSNWEIIRSTPTLAGQQGDNTGHFWYAPMTPEGAARRRQLARHLYNEGLR